MTNQIPAARNEQGRNAALKLYDILDTPAEQEFDNLAQLAAEICNTPIALINLIDEKRQWTKASVGIDLREIPRDQSFCHYTILDDEIFEVTNPLADSRFESSQLVIAEPGVRFYAGIPLINKDGYRLGTLCVMSPKHHQLNSYQRISLQILTASVMSLLELRRERKDAESYKKTLDEISVVSILDTHQNLIYANEQFCKMVGLSEEEMLGRNISEIKLSDITPEQANSISNSIVERRNWSGVIKNQNIKGIVSWSQLHIFPFTNKDNEIFRIMAVRQDVTREVLLQEQLGSSESLAKTGSWELNIFNRQTAWTPGMYELLEYESTEDKTPEQSIMSFIHSGDFNRVNDVNRRMLEKKSNIEFLDFRIVTKKGNEKNISAVVRKRFNSKGGLTGIFGTLQDITSRSENNSRVTELNERINELYNDAPCCYFSLDASGYILDMNETGLRWLEYGKEEIVGQMRLKDILHSDSYPFFDSSFYLLKKNGTLSDTHVLLKPKRAGGLHTLINAHVVTGKDGEFLYADYTAQDITELISLQDRLASHKTHRKAEATEKLEFTTDVDGILISFSPKLKAVMGFGEYELIGKKFHFAFDESTRVRALDFYQKQLHEVIEETTHVMPVKTNTGEKLWMELHAEFNIVDSNIIGFRFTMHDVSDKRKAEEEIQEVVNRAAESQKHQRAMLGKMSYDVRNPLNGVVGMINLLSTTHLSVEQKVLVSGMRESSAHMLKTLETLLEESDKIADGITVETDGEKPFEVKTLVNNLIINLKPEADKKNIRFILQVDNKIPSSVVADASKLSKILGILTGNALKHTERGSISISVLQKVVGQNMVTLEFVVKDTGIGMPQEQLNAIFDNKRIKSITDSDASLALAKQLIEEQNGILQAKTKIDAGTTFSFTFQCKLVMGTVTVKETSAATVEAGEKPKPILDDKSSLVGCNILLVEDNIMNQRVGRVTVENWGANVTVVDRGRKAIELVTTNNYDVILMDLQMPEMSGLEATEIIRRELLMSVPILGMTVSDTQGNREACIKAGMNDYILKPLNPVELHQKIMGLIHKSEDPGNDRLINMSYIRGITDDDADLMREILEIYIDKTPAHINDIDRHIETGDFKAVKSEVHYLKNSVGLLGADTLFHLLATIEDQLNYLPPSGDTLILLSKMKDIMRQSIEQTNEELEALQ